MTMALYMNTSGELAITPRPSKCVICGMPTDQPPVCYDLRCEDTLNRRHEQENDHEHE